MVTVDYWWHAQHNPILITDHRVPRLVTDNPEVVPQVAVGRVEIHKLRCGEFPGLVQWTEANFRRDFGIVDKRRLNGVKVVGADCN